MTHFSLGKLFKHSNWYQYPRTVHSKHRFATISAQQFYKLKTSPMLSDNFYSLSRNVLSLATVASFPVGINSRVVSRKAVCTLPNVISAADTIPRISKLACSFGRGLIPTQIALDSLTRSCWRFFWVCLFGGFKLNFYYNITEQH